MSDALDQQRAELEDVLRRYPPFERPAVLTGWVVVAEFADDEGGRWLSRVHAEGITVWGRQGMLYNALQEEMWEPEDGEDVT